MAGSRGLSSALKDAGSLLAGERCVVALSGGPDSAALAWIASRYAESARAVHVNHGLPASDTMQHAAEAVAAAVGLALATVTVEVPPGPSPEAQARSVRYGALVDRVAPGEVLLTGHTADDVAETVIINISRGAGVAGMASIPARRGNIVRPLIGCRRHEVVALAEAQELPFVQDPANVDVRLTRNRVRAQLMPAWQAAIRRDPVPLLVRAAHNAGAVAAVVAQESAAVRVTVRGGVGRVPLARLHLLSAAVGAEVVRRLLQAVRTPYPPTEAEVRRSLAVAAGSASRAELEGGWVVAASRTHLLAGPEPGAPPVEAPWSGDRCEFDGWILSRRRVDYAPSPRLATGMACTVPFHGERWAVRSVRRSDMIPVKGGTKPVRSLVAEAGVVEMVRDRHPVVTVDDRVVWIPGVRAVAPGWDEPHPSGYLSLDVVEEGRWK